MTEIPPIVRTSLKAAGVMVLLSVTVAVNTVELKLKIGHRKIVVVSGFGLPLA